MSRDVSDFLTEWHRIVRERDLVGLDGVLDENVSLGAPPYWDKLHGRKLIHHLLGLIVYTIDGFTYHREWCNGSELALEFTGRVGDRELQGIDLISLNDSFLVQNIDVLMRPVNSVIALRDAIAPKMAAFLSQGGDGNA